MDIVNLWGNVTENIGFYTKETASRIPNSPGIYAWYLPLWLYWEDMRKFMEIVQNVNLYDAAPIGTQQEVGQKRSRINFNWDYVDVGIVKGVREPNYLQWQEKWEEMLDAPEEREVFSQALMKASIFSPPLYIGRADDLFVRYNQHIEGREGANDFHLRFERFMMENGRALSVSDLLFSCIPFAQKDNKVMNDRRLTALLEKVMLHICRPPFSVK